MEKVANWVVEARFEGYAHDVLSAYGRIELIGQMAFLELTPVLAAFYGRDGIAFADMLMLNPRDGAQYLLKRINEITVERDKLKDPNENEKPVKIFNFRSWFSEKFFWLSKRLKK